MKKLFGLATILFSFSVDAQQTDCRQKLDSAYTVLSSTPSFRAQVTVDTKTSYDQLLAELRLQADGKPSEFQCFLAITKLFDPIRDNHLGFHQELLAGLSPEEYSNPDKVKAFRRATALSGTPTYKADLSTLRKKMAGMPADSVEGIYHYNDRITIAITRTGRFDSLVGVVLESKIPVWQPGELMLFLREYLPGQFRSVSAQPYTRNWVMTKSDRFTNGQLTETALFSHDYKQVSTWKKSTAATDYRQVPPGERLYQLRWLDSSTLYLRLGSFSASPAILEEANAFYDSISGQLTAPQLIVDLRNNGGGGFKNSRRVMNQLEKYARSNKLHILVNGRTVSNAEQFLILLKLNPAVKIYGERTCGRVTYGSNDGRVVRLPGPGKWVIYPTDMKEAGNTLRYEDVGVEPHVLLDNTGDWIAQVRKLIR